MSQATENPGYKSLIEMGCDASLSQAAVRNSKSENIDTLLDWVGNHEGEEEKWKQWLQDNKEVQEAPKGISQLVNKQMTEKLQQMGHSKNVSEKSLLFTNNASVQSAQAWINEHKYDPDFEDQLFLEGQAFQQSSLTPEEAKIKLQELTKKAREIRKKREEEDALEKQKQRLKYGKQMAQVKRISQQQAMTRQVQLDRIQKKKDADYKAQLLEQMRLQKNERLGIKQEKKEGSVSAPKKQQKQLSMLEQLEVQCQQVRVGMHAYPDRAKTFFETAQLYVNNIIKNNGQEKYRKINKQNKAFQSRILECFGGLETLEVIGYKDENGFLIMHDFDLGKLSKATEILGRYKQMF